VNTVIILDDVDFLLQKDGDGLLYYLSRTKDVSLVVVSSNHADPSSVLEERTYSSLHPRKASIEPYTDSIVLRPLSVSNDPDTVGRFNVIATNGAVEVDIYGNVNSSHVRGTELLQGIGGSGDFSTNSLVSAFVLRSKVVGKDISAIVPMVSHTDHTEQSTPMS